MAIAKVTKPAGPSAHTLAAAGRSGKPVTRAETPYLALVLGLLLMGVLVGQALVDDDRKAYVPPDGIGLFAVIFVITQAIERLLEIFAPFFGVTCATKAPPTPASDTSTLRGLVTKSQIVRFRDTALAYSLTTADDAERAKTARQAAWAQELLAQTRSNTATLWAVASALGMVAAGLLNVLLLEAIGADVGDARWLDVLVTGLVVGGGTKGLHELIGNIQKSKEQKATPAEMSGGAAG
jgi:hypothetical protein